PDERRSPANLRTDGNLDHKVERKNRRLEVDTLTSIIARIIRENGRDYLGDYAIAIVCLVVVALTTAFTAWIMEDVINEAFAKKNASVLWVICIAILAAFVLRGIATYGQSVILSKIGNNLVARYQRRLVDH